MAWVHFYKFCCINYVQGNVGRTKYLKNCWVESKKRWPWLYEAILSQQKVYLEYSPKTKDFNMNVTVNVQPSVFLVSEQAGDWKKQNRSFPDRSKAYDILVTGHNKFQA